MVIEVLLRQPARARYRRVLAESSVVPRDLPRVLSGETDAVRVLVLGSGVASGRGVATYGLALIGALQRDLQTSLGRAVDVELVRQHGLGIAEATRLALPRLDEDWDAYVLAFGLSDALQLTSPAEWSRSLGLLLSTIEDRRPSPFPVPVLVAGIPPVSSFEAHRGVLMPFFARHGRRLNDASGEVVALHPAASFTELPAMWNSTDRPFGSPEAYTGWAEVIARRLAPILQRREVRLVTGIPAEAGPLIQGVLRDEPLLRRLRALVAEATRAAGADYGVVRLLDGDHLYGVADSTGSAPRRVDRASTLCGVTLDRGFVAVSRAADPTTIAASRLPGSHAIEAYAGIVILDESGSPFGTLALFKGSADSATPAALLPVARSIGSAVTEAAGRRTHQATTDEDLRPDVEEQEEREESPDRPVTVEQAADGGGLLRRVVLGLRRPALIRTEGPRLIEVAQRRVTPSDGDVHLGGPDPVRVLIVGGGYGLGHGVESRRDALDGVLARLLHRRSGRGVEVTNRAAETSDLSRLAMSITATDSRGADVVLWTPVFEDAGARFSRTRWILQLSAFVRQVQATSDAAVVLTAFPSLLGNQPLAIVGRVRVQQVNRLLRLVAARFPRTYVAETPPIPLRDIDQLAGADVYRAAGVQMVDALVRSLQPRAAIG